MGALLRCGCAAADGLPVRLQRLPMAAARPALVTVASRWPLDASPVLMRYALQPYSALGVGEGDEEGEGEREAEGRGEGNRGERGGERGKGRGEGARARRMEDRVLWCGWGWSGSGCCGADPMPTPATSEGTLFLCT